MPDGGFPGGGTPEDGEMPDRENVGPENGSGNEAEAITYETAQSYIDSLNSNEEWIRYDDAANTVSITSIEAFDDLDRAQAENKLFGDDKNNALHFDAVIAELLQDNESIYEAFSDFTAIDTDDYQEYKTSVDALGNDSVLRQKMYNPMYYLLNYYEGYKSSTVASHWRIHSGITQSDTALTTEMNLALALELELEQYEEVEDVDFEMV